MERLIYKGHKCLCLPKFHCELNPSRGCGGRFAISHQPVFDSVSTDMMGKYFRRYKRAYFQGNSMKKYLES